MSELNELEQSVWIEKWRPRDWDSLIFDQKETIQKLISFPSSIPHMIFYSSKPGTGKTTLAKLIVSTLGCDCKTFNSSLERSIETVREEVNHFARGMSSVSGIKRCIFFDEADGLTRQAMDSLRNLMEDLSDNCFFILTANNLGKIIEPIQSRCQKFAFESPDKASIMVRLGEICDAEKLDIGPEALEKLIDKYYPDMRKCLNALQMYSIKGSVALEDDTVQYERFLGYIKAKNVKAICTEVYSGTFEILGFNSWYFHKLYQDSTPLNFDYTRKAATHLANVEKYSNMQVSLELIAIAEYLGIASL